MPIIPEVGDKQASIKFNKKLKLWLDKAREDKKPFCPSCMRLDYGVNELKDLGYYQKQNIKKIGEKIIRDSKTGDVKDIIIFYHCLSENGTLQHKFSCRYKTWELGLDKKGEPIEEEKKSKKGDKK